MLKYYPRYSNFSLCKIPAEHALKPVKPFGNGHAKHDNVQNHAKDFLTFTFLTFWTFQLIHLSRTLIFSYVY